MNGADYWRKRALKVKNAALVKGEQYEFDMAKRLANAALEVESAIDVWANKYADEDGTINADEARQMFRGIENHQWQNTLDEWERKARAGGYDHELNLEYYRSRISRLQALEAQLKNILAGYAKPEQVQMLGMLTNVYSDTYYRTVYNAQSQKGTFTADFAQFDTEELKKAVSKPWHGNDFSSRVWGNMADTLPDMLQKAVGRGIALGYNPEKLVKEARVTFRNFKKYQVHRLITTELAHATEEATYEAYTQSNIEQYEYLATLEVRTCDTCGHLDGKVFAVKDREEGVNYPVMHAHCRCTTAPWYEELADENTPRWARDSETGKGYTTDAQTFDDWLDEIHKERENKLSASEFGSDLKYVRSDEFKDKIKANKNLSQYSEIIQSVAVQMLRHRNGTPFEDIAVISRHSKQVETVYDGSRTQHGIDKYPNSFKRLFNSGNRNSYISVHNHPTSMPPSPDDLYSIQNYQNGTVKNGIVVGHDGTIYVYTRPTKKFPKKTILKEEWNALVRHQMVGSEEEKQLNAMRGLGKTYGFTIEKIRAGN